MAFVHKCPGCSQRLKVREEYLGRIYRCPKCDLKSPLKKVKVQAPEAVPEVDEGELPPMVAGLPPVSGIRKAKKKPKPVEEKTSVTDDLMYGRAQPLGVVNEEEWAEQQRMKKIMLGVAAGVMLLLAGGYVISNGAFDDVEVYLPKEFRKHAGPRDEFVITLPDDWTTERSKMTATVPPWFRAEGRKIKLSVRANPRGTAMGAAAQSMDVLNVMNGGGPPTPETEPVHTIHMFLRETFKANYSGYEEEPPKIVDTGFDSARYSRFSGRTAIGSKETGFRGTVLAGQWAYIVELKMPEWLMDEYEPFYRDILESMGP